ncbi:MAG: insulinase family protein [Candidatus Riflebacteria bacterium]|nr:insulinase family protein [Candidatus Riflebacteria bacterium]
MIQNNKTRFKFIILMLFSVCISTCFAADTITAKSKADSLPAVQFEKYSLPNGVQVILHIDRKLPIVHVNQWFHVGSMNEKPGKTGFAHVFEHIMFQGSKNAPGEYFTYVEKAGANLREGGVNGTTGNDRTNYFATVPSGNLEYLLWLESDRLATLIEDLDQKKLDNQRDVVRNERRMGIDNAPYGRLREILPENLFPPSHPYSWPVIGSHEDLKNASLEDVKDFFKTYYTPNNLSLVLAGDFNPEEAKKLIAKYYGSLQPGPALARPKKNIPFLSEEKIVEVNDRVPQTRIIMAWPTPAYFDKDDAELDVAGLILSDGLSSRLVKSLVYEKQLCSSIGAYQNGTEIAGYFLVDALLRKDADYREVEKEISRIIAELASNEPSKEELDRILTKMEFSFISNLERIGGFGGKSDLLNRYNVYFGNPDKFKEDFLRYQNMTPEDVKKATEKHLNTNRRLVIRFLPESSGRPAKEEFDRAKAPELGNDKDFEAPVPKRAILANGLEVVVIERNELPKVAVVLSSRAGSVMESIEKSGLANLVSSVMKKGSPARSAILLDEQFSNLGTSLDVACARENAYVSFEILKRNLEPALEIVSDIVKNPAFLDEEIERERKLITDSIAQQENDPPGLSARLTSVMIFGKEHPYGHPIAGFLDTLKGIKREELSEFHKKFWVASSSTLIFAGQVSLDEATKIAEKYFADWNAGNISKIDFPQPKPFEFKKIYVVDKQDAAQTHVAQILPGPDRFDADYYPLTMVDSIWGSGGFCNRLTLNLRENKGFTYRVRSGMYNGKVTGFWNANGLMQGDKTKEALIEFISELEGIAGKKAISDEEFNLSRDKRLKSFSQGFETLSSLVGKYSELVNLSLPLDEYNREYKVYKNMSLDKVKESASKWAVPEKSFFLLVGDYKKIEKGLNELNFGDVILIDKDGKPVEKK